MPTRCQCGGICSGRSRSSALPGRLPQPRPACPLSADRKPPHIQTCHSPPAGTSALYDFAGVPACLPLLMNLSHYLPAARLRAARVPSQRVCLLLLIIELADRLALPLRHWRSKNAVSLTAREPTLPDCTSAMMRRPGRRSNRTASSAERRSCRRRNRLAPPCWHTLTWVCGGDAFGRLPAVCAPDRRHGDDSDGA